MSWMIVARLANRDTRDRPRRLMGIAPPQWLVVVICFGSFFNPFAFFLRCPESLGRALVTMSCIATTVGYATVARVVAAAIAAANASRRGRFDTSVRHCDLRIGFRLAERIDDARRAFRGYARSTPR